MARSASSTFQELWALGPWGLTVPAMSSGVGVMLTPVRLPRLTTTLSSSGNRATRSSISPELQPLAHGESTPEATSPERSVIRAGSHDHGTPVSHKHSPPGSRPRDGDDLPYVVAFCPAFSLGLSRLRYDSPSMTRS